MLSVCPVDLVTAVQDLEVEVDEVKDEAGWLRHSPGVT